MTQGQNTARHDGQDGVSDVDLDDAGGPAPGLSQGLAALRDEVASLSRGRRAELVSLTVLVPGPPERLRPAVAFALRSAGFPAVELRLAEGAAFVLVAAEFLRLVQDPSPKGGQ